MCRLSEEIIQILKSHGTECSVRRRCGFDFICAGNPCRSILPIENRASCRKDAVMESEAAALAVRTVCQEDGEYPLIVTEDRWRSQRAMMEARLLAHLRDFTQIYARNCEVRRIGKAEASAFLAANHSYGDASCRYRYGIFLKRHTGHNRMSASVSPGTLAAVATFSNARKWVKGDKTIRSYEWTRYASLPGIRICGGMGKVLDTFISEVRPDDIMSYADLEWSEGDVYRTLGFTLEGYKEPVLFMMDGNRKRIPVRPGTTEESASAEGRVFYRNFGSNKYRIKLTDYE